MRHPSRLPTIALALALLLAACGTDSTETTDAASASATSTSTTAPTATSSDAPTTTASSSNTTAAAVEAPTDLSVAVMMVIVKEDPWNAGLVAALERAVEAKPHGLSITYELFENIDFPDAERLMRDLAASGKYDVIIGHSSFDQGVRAVKDEFPEIAFVATGTGFSEPLGGGNSFWLQIILHEPAYLTGVAAALMSENDSIGAVAAFPFPDVNGPVNGFFDGARSVKPEIETRVTYLESWFDPAKAQESATAMITVGADVVYAASTFGTFSAIEEGDPVFGVGDMVNLEALAPHAVITSTVALWDPALGVVIDGWWDHHANGEPWDGPQDPIVFSMAEGGGDIAPFNGALVPEEVQTAVLEVRDSIMNGDLVIEANPAMPDN
ncbi:MAG: BMP family ABC transporter substrate-binding protein [Acidimicrobiia bacterium]|nr:BMP family ABC transporter substrate-binding protein [Acidimicrobiia bacterium]